MSEVNININGRETITDSRTGTNAQSGSYEVVVEGKGEKKNITEDKNPFVVGGKGGYKTDEDTAVIAESIKKNKGRLEVKLPVGFVDKPTGNTRIYEKSEMDKSFKNIKSEMADGGIHGQHGRHPETFFVEPDKISHLITEAWTDNKGFIWNTWLLPNTRDGKDLTELFLSGAKVGVSIRGKGAEVRVKESGVPYPDVPRIRAYDYGGTDTVGFPSTGIKVGSKVPKVEIKFISTEQMVESCKCLLEAYEGSKPGANEATEYQKFFQKKLKQFGVKSPEELSDAKKKEFFNQIEKEWKGKKESGEIICERFLDRTWVMRTIGQVTGELEGKYDVRGNKIYVDNAKVGNRIEKILSAQSAAFGPVKFNEHEMAVVLSKFENQDSSFLDELEDQDKEVVMATLKELMSEEAEKKIEELKKSLKEGGKFSDGTEVPESGESNMNSMEDIMLQIAAAQDEIKKYIDVKAEEVSKEYDEKVKTAEVEVEEKTKETNKLTAQIEDLKKRVDSLEKSDASKKKVITKLEAVNKETNKYTKILESVVEGIRDYSFDQELVIDELVKRATYSFEIGEALRNYATKIEGVIGEVRDRAVDSKEKLDEKEQELKDAKDKAKPTQENLKKISNTVGFHIRQMPALAIFADELKQSRTIEEVRQRVSKYSRILTDNGIVSEDHVTKKEKARESGLKAFPHWK